jgi:hypothetical protein
LPRWALASLASAVHLYRVAALGARFARQRGIPAAWNA